MQESIKKVPGFVSFTSMFDSLITTSVAVFKGIEEERIGQEQTNKVNASLYRTKTAFIDALMQQGKFLNELKSKLPEDLNHLNMGEHNKKVEKLNEQIEELRSLLDTGKVPLNPLKSGRNNKEKIEAFMAERITSNKSKVQAIIKGMLDLANDVKDANLNMEDRTDLNQSYQSETEKSTRLLKAQLKNFNKAQNAQLKNNVRWVMRTLFGGLTHVTAAVVGIIVGVVVTVAGVTAAVALAVAKMIQVFMAAVVATIIFVGKFVFDMAFKVLPLLVRITASGVGLGVFAYKGDNLKSSQGSIENDWKLIKDVFVREKETLISTFKKLAALTTSISLEENKKASIDFDKELSHLAGFSRNAYAAVPNQDPSAGRGFSGINFEDRLTPEDRSSLAAYKKSLVNINHENFTPNAFTRLFRESEFLEKIVDRLRSEYAANSEERSNENNLPTTPRR